VCSINLKNEEAMARVGPQCHRKKKYGSGMKTVEDPVPVFGWPFKRPIEMVGVRAVQEKWPVCIVVRLRNATKNIKETE
jgi:hypothetical protein